MHRGICRYRGRVRLYYLSYEVLQTLIYEWLTKITVEAIAACHRSQK